jgi:1,4-dihydroxy-2-naphthoate polyprenyltransferase
VIFTIHSRGTPLKSSLSSQNTQSPWILAARPKTLPAAISPVFVGWGIAFSLNKFPVGAAIATLICALMVQVGTNYINDVVDFRKGTDRKERLGPVRVTQAGLLSPQQVWFGGITSFVIAGIAGLYLTTIAGWEVILIGAACFAAGAGYSMGKYSLVNIGLADLFALVFFGFVAVCGTVYVMVGQVPLSAWLSGLACGVLTTNILVTNNIRDSISDRTSGRRNIAVYFGKIGGEIEYLVMLVVAYLVPVLLFWFAHTPWLIFLPWLSLPLAMSLYRQLKRTPIGRGFNLLLAGSARLVLVYSVLLAFGFLLSRLWI